ncbi:hypothetical protein K8I31_13030, partial [bacterium]|nr:hypothetical protein [bacterium]
MKLRNALSVLLLILFVASHAQAQGLPSLPPLTGEGSDDGVKSFMDMLRNDLMKRLEDAKQSTDKLSKRAKRPEPELGKNSPSQKSIDISKYLGPDGDAKRTLEKLAESGKIPPSAVSSIPQHASLAAKQWKNVPLEKKMEYAEDLIRRRKPNSALDELDGILGEKELGEDEKIQALVLREKALLLL